jgi:hypothetical protein
MRFKEHGRAETRTAPSRLEQRAYLEDVVVSSVDKANAIFEKTFASIGIPYTDALPVIVESDNAEDISIYYKPQRGGGGSVYMNPTAWVTKSAFDVESITLHEMAHHAQNQLGILEYTGADVWMEDQADYLAGVLFSLLRGGKINPEEIRHAALARKRRQEMAVRSHQKNGSKLEGYGSPSQRAELFIEGATVGTIGEGLTRFSPSWVPSRMRELFARMHHPHIATLN